MSGLTKFCAPHPLCLLPAVKGRADVSVHNCSAGSYMAYLPHADKADFDAYCASLADNGFEKTAENTIKNNFFFTAVNTCERVRAHVYFVESAGELRIVASENIRPLPTSVPPVRTCKSAICQIDAAAKMPGLDEGMAYVLRLSDGRFIIIDGGYRRGVCAKNIYETLLRLASDASRIEIAAWIFTHGHNDHVGAFFEFAEMYSGDRDIKIDCFMYNMPLDPVFCENFSLDLASKIADQIAHYYRGVPVYTVQTGERYVFADATVEILFTPQDYMPRTIANEPDGIAAGLRKGDMNNLSVVCRITLGKSSFFVMADTTTLCCDEMCRRYGDYMRSDFVQASHHGLSKPTPRAHNATREIYDAISPRYAFMPCSAQRYQVRREYDVNAHLASIAKRIYVAGDGDVCVEP